jgi:cytochrome c
MKTLRITKALGLAIALALSAAALVTDRASAQLTLPSPKPPDGPTLFKQQCATCHTNNLSEPVRQGPSLFNVVGRRAGSVEGFRYSAAFVKADFVWKDAKLDAWIANPQGVIPGSFMAYRQGKPEVRAAIIAYLKELH